MVIKTYDPLTLEEHKDLDLFINILIEESELICDLFTKKYNKSTDQFKYILNTVTSLKSAKKVLKEQAKIDKINLKDKAPDWENLYIN